MLTPITDPTPDRLPETCPLCGGWQFHRREPCGCRATNPRSRVLAAAEAFVRVSREFPETPDVWTPYLEALDKAVEDCPGTGPNYWKQLKQRPLETHTCCECGEKPTFAGQVFCADCEAKQNRCPKCGGRRHHERLRGYVCSRGCSQG